MAQKTATAAEVGQHIFLYHHRRTNQVVYSLARRMDNNQALKQIPFLGKKTKPATLRKDMWKPFATVSFPTARQGLFALHQLREFKKRHEHEWTWEELGLIGPMHKRKYLGRALQNQVENSVADLAIVLKKIEAMAAEQQQEAANWYSKNKVATERIQTRRKEILEERTRLVKEGDVKTPEGWAQYKALKAEKMRLGRIGQKPNPYNAVEGIYDPRNETRPAAKRGPGASRKKTDEKQEPFTMDGIKVEWDDLMRANLAHWPDAVVHDIYPTPTARVRHVSPVSETPDYVPMSPESYSPAETPQPSQTISIAAPSTVQTVTAREEVKSAEEVPAAEQKPMLEKILHRLKYGRT